MSGFLRVISLFAVFLGAAAFMEFVAWWLHKYVMHGAGWFLHADHHKPLRRGLQKNDAYFLVFASISAGLIIGGAAAGNAWPVAAGLGVALYGAGYVLFHEIMFHKRARWLKLPVRGRYLQALVASHRVHHMVPTKNGGSHFAFLLPEKLTDAEKRSIKHA